MKCPSRFCNHENPDNARYCGECHLDLSVPEKEIKARDTLYEVLKELSKQFNLGFEITRELVDHIIERYGASLTIQLLTTAAENKIKEEPSNIELSKTGLYSILLKRLKRLEKRPERIIGFPKVFSEVCTNFKMTKEECWDILLMLNEFKLIKIVPFNGIRLLY